MSKVGNGRADNRFVETCALLRRGMLKLAVCLAVLCAPYAAFGRQYSFKIYSGQQGLRNQVINFLLQDRDGFLWAGTEDGLYRYDGYRFTFFGQAEGLPDNTIHSLHQSSDGTLWVGTQLGVATWNGSRFSPDPDLGQTELFGHSNILSGPQGQLYIGTARGLAVRDSNRKSSKSRFHFLTTPSVHGLYVDASGTVWFGADGTLCFLRKGEVTELGPASGIPKDRWDSMLIDGAGTFWIRSSERLMKRSKDSPTFQSVPAIPHSPEFGVVSELRDGRIVVPTSSGLMIFDGKSWERVGARQGLVSDETVSLLQDREGSVWVGLGGEGLERWIGFDEWESWTVADGLASNIVWDLQRDHSGQLWIASENGLQIQNSATGYFRWRSAHGLSVRTVLEDPAANAVWYGANPGECSVWISRRIRWCITA